MNYSVRLTDTAKQFVNKLRDECQKLETFPSTGATPRDRVLKSMGYRFTVHNDYLIFYMINENEKQVDIMAIFNAKRDYMRLIRKII